MYAYACDPGRGARCDAATPRMAHPGPISAIRLLAKGAANLPLRSRLRGAFVSPRLNDLLRPANSCSVAATMRETEVVRRVAANNCSGAELGPVRESRRARPRTTSPDSVHAASLGARARQYGDT